MDNNWSGTIEFHKFLKLQNLTDLRLSGNKPEVLMGSTSMNNATIVVPKFERLVLRGCNISEFPDFLRSQDSLLVLDLSGNGLHGRVPKWMWNMSTQTLKYLIIPHNFLSGFDRPPSTIPWVNLEFLELASNSLVGEIPPLFCNVSTLSSVGLSDNKLSGVLPQCLGNTNNDLQYLFLGNNNLSGKVSPQICNLTKLSYLDLSSNKLSGMLPQCLGPGLEYLNLANNTFHGILPKRFTTASCDLSMIDVSHNKLQGQLPRSLVNCASLEFLVLSNNQFDDVFPLWLGPLQKLKILAMRHNGFYGVIGQPKKNRHFPELRILDLSYNNFRGKFPAEYIFSGNAIRGITSEQGSYDSYDHYLQCSISITNKGIEIYYPKIQDDLVVIHLSNNKFEGNIPQFIGKLKGLRLLNISNNSFTGCIPLSFGDLTVLESLDLSHNQLSGEIPQQLSQLSFLEKFNVSHNNLTGRIPGGTQLSTFDVTSFEGNPRLCGDPLPKKCENPEGINLPPSTTNPKGSGIEVDWKFALAGLGSGLVVGVVLADVVITRWDEWFIEIVDMLIRLVKRMRRFRNE
ncbi:PREDICTED: receptor-like protein 12-like [Fragaria vesca subsp. vesca]